jgi:hypothetical protein
MLLVNEDVGNGALVGDLLQSVLDGGTVFYYTKRNTSLALFFLL